LSDDLAQFDLFKDFLVADYHILKSLILPKSPWMMVSCTATYDIIYKEMPKPDLTYTCIKIRSDCCKILKAWSRT
jgi:hypothetical protein